jgi:hypothetical protein
MLVDVKLSVEEVIKYIFSLSEKDRKKVKKAILSELTPFEKETLESLKQVQEDRKNGTLKTYSSVSEMMKELTGGND